MEYSSRVTFMLVDRTTVGRVAIRSYAPPLPVTPGETEFPSTHGGERLSGDMKYSFLSDDGSCITRYIYKLL